MARIRTVKPELFSSATMARCSRDARLLFVGLLTEADDEGRFIAAPKRLAGTIFPYDEDVESTEISEWLGELESAGCVERYRIDEVTYGYLPGWADHQRISKPTASKLPGPTGSKGPPGVFAEDAGETPESPGESRPGSGKGTGNREQGTGKNQSAEKAPRPRDLIFDALGEIEGSNLAELTRAAARTIGTATAQIRKASPDVTPGEIHRRAAIYPQVMPPGSTLTASALAKHWPKCGRVPPHRPGRRDPAGERLDRAREMAEQEGGARATEPSRSLPGPAGGGV